MLESGSSFGAHAIGLGGSLCCRSLRTYQACLGLTLLTVGMVGMGHSEIVADEELPIPVIAIQENAERLRSGEYRARGLLRTTVWKRDPERTWKRIDPTTYVRESRIEAAFDFDAERNLFRRRRTDISDPERAGGEEYRWYLSTPEQTVLLRGSAEGRYVSLHPPTDWREFWPSDAKSMAGQPIFDPRQLGWAGWMSLGNSFAETFDTYFRRGDIRSKDLGGGIIQVESTHKIDERSSRVTTFWCDEQQGWQPVRYTTVTVRTSTGREIRDSKPRPWIPAQREDGGRDAPDPKPFDVTELSWERHEDAWVVNSLSIQYRGGIHHDLTLEFDWQNVNGPVPEDRFDWKTWRNPEDYQQISR